VPGGAEPVVESGIPSWRQSVMWALAAASTLQWRGSISGGAQARSCWGVRKSSMACSAATLTRVRQAPIIRIGRVHLSAGVLRDLVNGRGWLSRAKPAPEHEVALTYW
jgi:hypothetical protein